MQSVTTLISVEEALRRSYEAVKAAAAEDYGHDGKVYVTYLEQHLQRAFAEPPHYVPEPPQPWTIPLQQPEIDICPRCGEHAEFVLDDDKLFESVCCGARPIDVDPS